MPMPNPVRQTLPASIYVKQAGTLEATSPWVLIDQSKIDLFANVTNDHQFIHVDVKRTIEETNFTNTIAHGFLSLSMLSSMIETSFPTIENASMVFNYGFDKIRFLNPVTAGTRIRGHFKLMECSPRNSRELLSRYQVSIEIENIEKPALVAEWLGLAIMNKESTKL